jgi:PAS domain S-box
MDAFVRTVGGLVSYVDSEGRLQCASNALAEWMGQRPEDLVGRTLREIYGDESYGQFHQWTTRALAGEDVHYERQARHADGSSRWLSVNLRPHRDANGRSPGISPAPSR